MVPHVLRLSHLDKVLEHLDIRDRVLALVSVSGQDSAILRSLRN